MKKTILILSGIFFISICNAQLNKLCPVSSTVYNKEKLEGLNLLLNTKDFTPVLVPGGATKRTSSVQLVKATQPFPPLWFQMGNPDKDTSGFITTTFLLDIRIQKNKGNLTFFSSYPGSFYGSTTFDTSTLQPIDTLQKYAAYTEYIRELFDLHDYQIDANGNKLFINQVKRKIDARCLSGLEKDSIRYALMNDILILNDKDSIVFKWNPIEHLSPCEMHWKYQNASLTYGDLINWSHVNSVRFANDGNIIYSFRHIGLGKINIKTGEIMWKLGGKDSLNSIPLADKDAYFLQHDFLQREDGLYSLFSNGDSSHLYLEGIVYKIDEEKKKAKVVSRYRPQPQIFSKALGSYDCHDDVCVIDFGMYPPANPNENQDMAHILVKNKLVAKLSAPAMNFSYQIHQTKWAAIKRRPIVILKNEVLYSDNKEGLHDYTWYKIDSTVATPVGTGMSFSPTVSGKYVVEAQQGIGLFKSYLVSDVFEFSKK